MDVVEQHFRSLDFKEAINKEKDIVLATKVTDWREPLGTVAILGDAWSTPHLQHVSLISRSVASRRYSLGSGNCCRQLCNSHLALQARSFHLSNAP